MKLFNSHGNTYMYDKADGVLTNSYRSFHYRSIINDNYVDNEF